MTDTKMKNRMFRVKTIFLLFYGINISADPSKLWSFLAKKSKSLYLQRDQKTNDWKKGDVLNDRNSVRI